MMFYEIIRDHVFKRNKNGQYPLWYVRGREGGRERSNCPSRPPFNREYISSIVRRDVVTFLLGFSVAYDF